MKIISKNCYVYTVVNDGKTYNFVTSKTVPLFKRWFDKVHHTVSRYENIKYYKIPQSKYNTPKFIFI